MPIDAAPMVPKHYAEGQFETLRISTLAEVEVIRLKLRDHKINEVADDLYRLAQTLRSAEPNL